MQTLQPILNLLIVLTILSVAAERITNILKLRRAKLRLKKKDEAGEKEREKNIASLSLLMGVGLCLLLKADFFEIVTNLQNPWQTLGWVQIHNYDWSRAPASESLGPFFYAIGGCIVTGIALGFGSKFWHDMLDLVYELKRRTKKLAEG